MVQSKQSQDAAAWRAATWEGATREAMRRWAKLPLERMVAAQEEMWELAEELNRQENAIVGARPTGDHDDRLRLPRRRPPSPHRV